MTRHAAYYNEIDPHAAQWLRNLVAAGHIAPGDVDERSIEDVRPDDIRGYRQCHFFAGIGVWSYALRRAGVADSARVWTGSCPCQPFSTAGKGDGFADERHLWPAWLHLISQCEPERIYGEQVAGGDAVAWIDLVQTDMEALGYAFGAVAFPSAGVGAPHIRDRLYWMADAVWTGRPEGWPRPGGGPAAAPGSPLVVADAHDERLEGRNRVQQRAIERATGTCGVAGRLADADQRGSQSRNAMLEPGDDFDGCPPRRLADSNGERLGAARRRSPEYEDPEQRGCAGAAGPLNGFWRAADWLGCTDAKWRPVEPGTFPLAHGAASRVGRLRAYGNAINAEAALVFIEACGVTP